MDLPYSDELNIGYFDVLMLLFLPLEIDQWFAFRDGQPWHEEK